MFAELLKTEGNGVWSVPDSRVSTNIEHASIQQLSRSFDALLKNPVIPADLVFGRDTSLNKESPRIFGQDRTAETFVSRRSDYAPGDPKTVPRRICH